MRVQKFLLYSIRCPRAISFKAVESSLFLPELDSFLPGGGGGGGGQGRPMADPGAKPQLPGPSAPLLKHRSWSPDSEREEAWARRQDLHRGRRGKSRIGRSVTDDDLDELRGCIDLGFAFDSPDAAASAGRLSETLPALELYYAVQRIYCDSVARSSPSESSVDGDSSPVGSPLSILSPGDEPETVKARLKQWARVVACSVRQRYG